MGLVPIHTRRHAVRSLPSAEGIDLMDEAVDLFIPEILYSPFLVRSVGGDAFSGPVMEAMLWQSDSTSVFAASSFEEDSGLVVQRPEFFCPLEEGDEAIQGTPPAFSLGWEDVDLVVLFCSEEWEESDSMLPMGVLSGLLLYESPGRVGRKQAHFSNGILHFIYLKRLLISFLLCRMQGDLQIQIHNINKKIIQNTVKTIFIKQHL